MAQTKTELDMFQINRINTKVTAELIRALKKFPTHPDDLIHQAAIIAEESGELIQACLGNTYEKLDNRDEIKKEVIQTAAMCLRMLIHLR